MQVTVGLGSNLGDRLAHLRAALAALAAVAGRPLTASAVYETAPVGGVAQPDYLNAVVVAELPDGTELWPLAEGIEASRGRVRAERFGPRTLDVDLLDVDGRVSADPALTLPHPRAHERAFVLVPWAAVAPQAVLPGHGRVAELAAALPAAERATVRLRPDLDLTPA